MTGDENRMREQSVDAILKGVAKKTALIVSLAAAAALVYAIVLGSDHRWWFLPASILFGGALGLLNFRWLADEVADHQDAARSRWPRHVAIGLVTQAGAPDCGLVAFVAHRGILAGRGDRPTPGGRVGPTGRIRTNERRQAVAQMTARPSAEALWPLRRRSTL